MRRTDYQPLFPWFGGKSPVADIVWSRLGDAKNYVEPFFGSGAILFLRPDGAGPIETVNDADGLLSNFWRALQNEPDAVAEFADWPVNEADLHARHLWLLGERERITERLMGDPDFYDAKAAGWWVWGQCCWIGSGWCSGRGPWISENGVLALRDSGQGVNRQLPHLGNSGKGGDSATPGIHKKRPAVGGPGGERGVNRKRPNLGAGWSSGGRGVNRDSAPEGIEERAAWLRDYLGVFASRLARVRVCCGDWSRVCGPSVTFRHGMTGVFLDPPYADSASRTDGLYANDCQQVAHAVREWAIENGDNPGMRICLAGYEGEHEMPATWTVHEWEAVGGYGLISEDDEATGRANKDRERLWFSPHCVPVKKVRDLFSDIA